MKKKNYTFVPGVDEKQEEYNFPDREKIIHDQTSAFDPTQQKTALPTLPLAYASNISDIAQTKVTASAKLYASTEISDIPATVTEAINAPALGAQDFIPSQITEKNEPKHQKGLKSKLFIIISAVLALIVIILLAIIISGKHTTVADATTAVSTIQKTTTDNSTLPAVIVTETETTSPPKKTSYIELCYYSSDWSYANENTEFVWDFMRTLRDYAQVTINNPQDIQDKPGYITNNRETTVFIFFTPVDDNLQPIDFTGNYPDFQNCIQRLLFTTEIDRTDLPEVSAKTKYGVFLAYFDETNGGLDSEHLKFVEEFTAYFIDNCNSMVNNYFDNSELQIPTTEISAQEKPYPN